MADLFDLRNEHRGALMIEGLIVYLITMLLLFFILSLYMVLYQRWNIQVIANETAAKVGQTFRFPSSDLSTGEVDVSTITSIDPYRYTSGDSWKEDSTFPADEYAKRRLSNTSFVRQSNPPEVESKAYKDALGRCHIEVNISGSYKVPFGDSLAYFGFPGVITYDATGYAQALDLSVYLSDTAFMGQISELDSLGDVSGVIDATIGVINMFFKQIPAWR